MQTQLDKQVSAEGHTFLVVVVGMSTSLHDFDVRTGDSPVKMATSLSFRAHVPSNPIEDGWRDEQSVAASNPEVITWKSMPGSRGWVAGVGRLPNDFAAERSLGVPGSLNVQESAVRDGEQFVWVRDSAVLYFNSLQQNSMLHGMVSAVV